MASDDDLGEGPARGGRALPRWADDVLGVLQAAFGDVIERDARGLSTPLGLYDDGRPLPPTPSALAAARPVATGRIVLLIHGLGCHEGTWRFSAPRGGDGTAAGAGDPGHARASAPPAPDTYGTRLARDLGYTPYAVRYNTGLPIPRNGARLAALLDQLCAAHPVPVTELTLVGHSMGGLVARAACAAAPPDARWLAVLRHVITLGTPHDGAPLERLVHHASTVLGGVGTTATDVLRDVLSARSAGIRDLRFGRVRDAAPEEGPDHDVPWPAHVRLHRVVGLLGGAEPVGAVLGDGMVRAGSAGAPRGEGDVVVVRGVSHLGLLHDARVYEAVRGFCEARDAEEDAG